MAPRIWVRSAALLLPLACALVGGCTTPRGAHEPNRPTFVEVACPEDVLAALVGNATCGYVKVAARHARPGPTIRVFVTRIAAPGSAVAAPVLVVGTDLAALPNYGGLAPLMQRTGRDIVIVDSRGTGHSEPALDCPEVSDMGNQVLSVASDDPSLHDNFRRAVRACHDRLVAAGIDIGAFNQAEMAADVEEVRRALGVATWSLATYGTASGIALEVARLAPDHVSAVVLDSPDMPGRDPRLVAMDSAAAVDSLLLACERDRSCSRRFPAARTLWPRAVAALAERPLVLRMPDGTPGGREVAVRLDPGLLVRVVRNAMSAGYSTGRDIIPGAVPALLEDVLQRRTETLVNRLTRSLQWPQAFCVGYLPRCLPVQPVSLGTYYSVLCHDVPRWTGSEAPSRPDPAVTQAYAHSPYLDLCDNWPIAHGTTVPPTPVQSSIPTLVLVGTHAPYTSASGLRERLRGLQRAVILEIPGTHNVLPTSECLLDFRTAWLADPSSATKPPPCLADERMTWELS